LTPNSQVPNSKPTINYFQKCMEHRIVPKPSFAKTDSRTLSMIDIFISDAMADALAAFCEQTKDDIRVVYLVSNGLKDAPMAKVLRSLRDQKLEKLVLSRNDIGLKSMAELQNFFRLESLKTLELCDLNFDLAILQT
jgi:hypothetical protein